MDIKALIFDFGNVIGNFDHMITCHKLSEASGHTPDEIYQLIFKSGLEKEYDEGLSFEEFHKKVIRVINPNREISLGEFEDTWGDIFSENHGIEQILEKVPSHIRIFLLSNTNPVHWKRIEKLPAIAKFFRNTEQQILSFRIGERKPSKKIYEEGIQRAGVPADQIVYVDDIPQFVDAFKDLGGYGVVYNSADAPAEKLEQALNQFGVIK